jgi:diguanylate cyclase (GGDEF)-like protein/PAS domain S-box-containing protein
MGRPARTHWTLRRIAALSARPVTPGGESGAWRWLVPALALLVLGLLGQQVLSRTSEAREARDTASIAQELSTDVVLSDDKAQLRERVKVLRTLEPTDPTVEALSRELWLPADQVTRASVRRSVELARAVDRQFAERAAELEAEARNSAVLMLGVGAALALLLVWSFWARRAAAQAALHGRRFRSLVQNASDLILVVADDGTITECTPVVETMLGRKAEDTLGAAFTTLVHPEDEVALDGGGAACSWRAAHADGTWVDVESTATDLRSDPSVRGIVLVVRDVRERKAFEQQLHHAAFHDALTGLPNRTLFEDRVRHALAAARRSHTIVAVLFVDLDDFKTVNDSLGHQPGDDLLRMTAKRLEECLRAGDTAARLGGDEFAVLVEGMTDPGDVEQVAERIHGALDRPFVIGSEELFVRASIGIAVHEPGQLDQELLRNADTAMYAAKAAGKGRHQVFHPVMHDTAKRRLQLTGDLRRAVDRGEFSVDYQPLVDLSDGRVLGAEALVRWEHPTYGRIAPADFIPLAEETGLIGAIGEFVLREACRQAATWQDEGNGATYVSVNLSPRQFRPPGRLVEQVKRLTAEAGLDPSCLLLEITESVLVNDREIAAKDLQELRGLGVRVAIDDFGTGYSSLAYLRDFPIDIVKMDRSFVQELGRGRADDALVRSVVELGDALDMQIVAEGIEDIDQLDSLRDLHCAIGQGYYFSEPVSGADIAEILRAPRESRRPGRTVPPPTPAEDPGSPSGASPPPAA